MSKAARNAVVFLVIGAVLAVAGYWYWSPFLAMRSMRAAAQAQDAERFNQYVDYAKLRESLKGQFAAHMAGVLGSSGSSDSDIEKAGSALGAMLGMALVDRFIDAMVRPEVVMQAMNDAKLRPAGDDRPSEKQSTQRDDIKWVVERKGADRVVAYGHEADKPQSVPEQGVGFVFDRTGFADWKLTEIRLPSAK